MSDNKENHWESKWAYRLAGIGFVIGTVWGFVESDGEILESLLTGAGMAFVVLILWGIISVGISIASEQTNPFTQGMGFALGIVVALTLLDLALMGGMFLIWPFFTLLFGGDWSQTYWGCMEHWVCVEEGCWCGRQD